MSAPIYTFHLYIRKLPILIMSCLTLALHLFIWGWLLWHIRPQEESIFLHYTVLFGVDSSGPWHYMLYLPITGLVVAVVNTILGWIVYQKDHLVSYVFHATTLVVHVFLVIVTTLLVFLNV